MMKAKHELDPNWPGWTKIRENKIEFIGTKNNSTWICECSHFSEQGNVRLLTEERCGHCGAVREQCWERPAELDEVAG